MTAITLCGPAIKCSACGVLPPMREQFGPCSRAHAAIGQRCLVASICCRATSSLSDTGCLCGPALTLALCVCHVAHARVEFSGPRAPLCSRCQFLLVLGCSLLVLLVSGTLQRNCQSKCRRSVVRSEHHGRLSVAPVAIHNPCLFDGTRGI